MSYSDYTSLQKLTTELGITHKRQVLFTTLNPVTPSAKLIDDINEAQNYYSLTTEKAKEAKNRSIEEGFAQCAAEMFAALLFNEQNKNETALMYGCVTNGYEWCFLKLENNKVSIDIKRFFLNDLAHILGVFQLIITRFSVV